MRHVMHEIHMGLALAGVGVALCALLVGCGLTGNSEPEEQEEESSEEVSNGDDDNRSWVEGDREALDARREGMKSDGFEQARDDLVERLSAQLVNREIDRLAIPEIVLPGNLEFWESAHLGDARRGIQEVLYYDHRHSYVEPRAHLLNSAMRSAVTEAPVFGRIMVEDSMREELREMILDSLTDDFSPDEALRLGQFSAAEAVLFSRLTTAFEPVRRLTPFTSSAYWVRGTYIVDVNLVDVEEGAVLWDGTVEWERVFLVRE